MERAAVELERRSRHLSSLIRQQKKRNGCANRAPPAAEEVAKAEGKQEKAAPGKGEDKEEEEVVVVVEERKEAREPGKGEKQRKGEGEKQRKGEGEVGRGGGGADAGQQQHRGTVRVRAADMPPDLQKRAFRCAQQVLAQMPKLDCKRLALTLKKEFDSSCGPAWHCIVGKSFGSYVTHSLGGFLYFSIDKVYILLFRTAVEPLEQ